MGHQQAEKLVFVADDYDHLADLIAKHLQRETRCEAIALKDGAEVLALAESRRPDACILDVDMPRIGGTEAARALRQKFPENCPLLIGVSGVEPLQSLMQSRVFDRVLIKPLDMAWLTRLMS